MSSTESLPTRGSSFFTRRDRARERPSEFGHVHAGETIGEFRLVEPLGRGGMGEVWLAEQLSLKRQVALKLVLPERLSAATLALFGREARAGGRLSHPGVVAVHEFGTTSQGLAWIAMELVKDSWTLRDCLDNVTRDEHLGVSYFHQVADFIARTADALHAAHEAGVIHRDVKPGNILITQDGHPKVTDFGLARITDEAGVSRTGDFAGTYAYMSPEQVAGNRIGLDYRTDVFSLGITLYEMLALRRPFEGDTTHQIGRQILLEDPPDPRLLRSRIPADLAVISRKCLEKHPDRRYQSMAELAADVRRHMATQPILAKQPSTWELAAKWVRRHPAPSAAAAVGAAAFLIISVLLGENVRSNIALARSNEDLGRTLGERDVAIASLSDEVAAVKRLSALQDYDDLVAEADDLWPPYPQHVQAYSDWITRARELLEELALHRAKRDELRAWALPQSAAERDAERRSHPDYARLARFEADRAALHQRRDGIAVELPEGREAFQGDARELMALATPLVGPERLVFGDEPRGLALALRAVEVAESTDDIGLCAATQELLSRALFSVGRDDAALEAIQVAVDLAPDAQRTTYQTRLSQMRDRVERATSARGLAAALADLEERGAEIAELDARVAERRDWRFPDDASDARWWHAQLTKLIDELDELDEPEVGLLGNGISRHHGWGVGRRQAFARRLADRFGAGGEYSQRWSAAIVAIREEPLYAGLELAPQMGLVPIGPDPATGLWEFWHVATGDEPSQREGASFAPGAASGLQLVLVPGGTSWIGAINALGHNPDPGAEDNERSVEVTLSPYFLSKYEMTQAQWLRMTGRNPSYYAPGSENRGTPYDLRHPVEMVSWTDCARELPRQGLALPTEAQWEHAARAGTTTPWWTGAERDSLRARNAANLADRAALDWGMSASMVWDELDDGYGTHAPVGTYAPNTFGLFEVHGNVWEWCVDGYDADFYRRSTGVDPEAPSEGVIHHILRGGSFASSTAEARSAFRNSGPASSADDNVGVRPARRVE